MSLLHRTASAALALAALTGAPTPARAADPALAPLGVFAQPVGVAAPADDASRLFVVERGGQVVQLHDGRRSAFLDLGAKVKADGYEQGLLGMALAPDFSAGGKFYVYYTTFAPGGGIGSDIVVSEITRSDPDHADVASERVLLRIPHRLEQYENGGQLAFGPDGLLWIGTGDGGGENDAHGNAQRLDPGTDDPAQGRDALLGKLLRIDPAPGGGGCGGRCRIPASNPGFAQPEVWAYGLRNPWRFSFDRATGDLAIGDVGQGKAEEVDLGRAPDRARGANFGWPMYEGSQVVAGASPSPDCCSAPVLERAHGGAEAFDAIIGGVVVRDPGLPALAGRYLYAGTGQGHVHSVDLAAPSDDRDTGLAAAGLTSFGEDACGRVYVTTFGGYLFRMTQGVPACGGTPATPGDPATAPGGGGPAGTTIKRKAPVTISAAARQRALRTGVVRVTVRCAVACATSGRGAFRVTGRFGLRTAAAAAKLKAGATTTLNLRIPAPVRRMLVRSARRGRRVSVAMTVTTRPVGAEAQTARVTARIVR